MFRRHESMATADSGSILASTEKQARLAVKRAKKDGRRDGKRGVPEVIPTDRGVTLDNLELQISKLRNECEDTKMQLSSVWHKEDPERWRRSVHECSSEIARCKSQLTTPTETEEPRADKREISRLREERDHRQMELGAAETRLRDAEASLNKARRDASNAEPEDRPMSFVAFVTMLAVLGIGEAAFNLLAFRIFGESTLFTLIMALLLLVGLPLGYDLLGRFLAGYLKGFASPQEEKGRCPARRRTSGGLLTHHATSLPPLTTSS